MTEVEKVDLRAESDRLVELAQLDVGDRAVEVAVDEQLKGLRGHLLELSQSSPAVAVGDPQKMGALLHRVEAVEVRMIQALPDGFVVVEDSVMKVVAAHLQASSHRGRCRFFG
eukprot:CAMPEP_0170496198 /NCGR_PEP_ID=MMETSP0208-20121228/20651_1 /TAXON_ID=197538 /ORGANISM="Strombidium inclinatum, Strain S3" /LENGTH=112 /DNA_ID=CAMNT_0010772671 /DNA_START=760 /DNA_END=1099 /DNA_ORIENTATION=-